MHCFVPTEGKQSLASEVAEAEAAGECTLLICNTVADELREVVERDLPNALPGLETFLERYGVVTLPEPKRELLAQTEAVCVDPDDAPILAAAVQSSALHGALLLLSNDFETFHTPQMKAFLFEHGMVPVSLYRLLKVVGRR